jgi:hypothetical protein
LGAAVRHAFYTRPQASPDTGCRTPDARCRQIAL